jgi:hypothetical protein
MGSMAWIAEQRHQLEGAGIGARLLGIMVLCLAGCGGANGVSTTSAALTDAGASAAASDAALSTKATAQSLSVKSASIKPLALPEVVTSARFAVAMEDMEVIGPFASWANAKVDYHAVGDGVADDAPALQRALDDLGKKGKASVLYLPAGTYKLGSTLKLTGSPSVGGFGWGGLGLIGEAPDTTRLVWAGPAGDPMLVQDGGAKYRYARITWDGKGQAGYGVAHWWNAKGGAIQDGGPEHIDEVFMDMKIGIMAGRLGVNYGELNSEGQVRRVTFLRNSFAGVDTGSWNADNWWVWDSHFVDCARGVSNNFSITDTGTSTGAGGLFVYRSFFERSTVADFHIGNTGWFSMYQNVSIGSRRFFQGDVLGNNSAQIIIKGNRIVDTTDPTPISNGNVGPLILIDNEVRSGVGVTAPAVVVNDFASGRDVISLGNKYTVASPIKQVDTKVDRLLTVGDTTVSRSAISSAAPSLPATPARVTRQVFEVEPGATALEIQDVVNAAAASGAVNPIVHLPPGEYSITRTIVLPAATRIQFSGDAMTTALRWKGIAGGTFFQLQGPSLVTLRDFQATGQAYLATISGADQVGGRIYLQANDMGVIAATNLLQTQLHLQSNPAIGGFTLNNVRNLVSVANGGLGPVKTTNNSSVFIADTWYEGSETELYRLDSGTLTYIGGHMGPATHAGSGDTKQAPIVLDGFKGQATFIGTQLNIGNIANWSGIQMGAESTETNAMFLGMLGFRPGYFKRSSNVGNVGLLMSKTWNVASNSVATQEDQGTGSGDFVNKMLTQLRALSWDTTRYTAPDGATDVRMYRMKVNQTKGLIINGSP